MTEQSKYQKELEALPEWAQKMVRAASQYASYGIGGADLTSMSEKRAKEHTVFIFALKNKAFKEWFDGFLGMMDLAQALTAPWPPPEAPARERRAFNIVELVSDDNEDEGGGFVGPCAFGSLVPRHAVYCHNEAWPNSPRKCRRNRDDYRHESCPGFVANPDYVDKT